MNLGPLGQEFWILMSFFDSLLSFDQQGPRTWAKSSMFSHNFNVLYLPDFFWLCPFFSFILSEYLFSERWEPCARVWFQHAQVWFQHTVWFQYARVLFQYARVLSSHKCDIHTHSVKFTRTTVISERKVWFQHAGVWFIYADCNFHTQNEISTRKV
jgi:hypothetical protein